jgi:hypothetical protein
MFTVLTSQTVVVATAEAEYVLAPDVVLLLTRDGSGRLLDMGGRFYALPAVGAEMLRATLERGSEAAVRQIAERSGAAPGRVRADLAAWLDQLERQGAIRRRQARRPRLRPRSTWLALVLIPALRLIHRCLRSPQARAGALLVLARLSFALLGWARTVEVWRRYFPRGKRCRPGEEEGLAWAVDEAVRRAAAQHVLRMACKERALCCWVLARAEGVEATLVVGMNLFPLAGHCWCEAGARTLSDDRDRCDMYTPIIRYQ